MIRLIKTIFYRIMGLEKRRIAELRQNLRLKVLYDEEIIDRLIDRERRLKPDATEIQLYEIAIAKWERDNR